MQFKNRFIRVTHQPIIIVGECPGKQRKKDQNMQVFHGNRTGDFIEGVIAGFENIILTNACNWQKPQTGNQQVLGLVYLQRLINKHNPRKIICLGHTAMRTVERIICFEKLSIKPIKYPHPSYILRFNVEPMEYAKKLKNEIKESLQHN